MTNTNTTILVTGCAGFIDSNFVPYFLDKYEEHSVVNLDLPTYAGVVAWQRWSYNANYKAFNQQASNTHWVGGITYIKTYQG